MGVEGTYPVIEVVPPATEFEIYRQDGPARTTTTHANMMCVLPAPPGSELSWFRRPPHPPHYDTFEFASTSAARVVSGGPLPWGQAFQRTRFVIPTLGRDDGWLAGDHPRFVADLTGDGTGDLVGFGEDGVWTALGDGAGSFSTPKRVLKAFAPQAGNWNRLDHVRLVADLTGDGRADLVGFGDDGVWTALGDGAGGFGAPAFVLADFGKRAFGWDVLSNPRFVTDLTGDGRADILGFGDDSVWVALGDGAGGFGPTQFGGHGLSWSSGWGPQPGTRLLADLTGDGRPDIVAFGADGVWTALNDGAGHFTDPQLVLAELGEDQGWGGYTRRAADTTGDGRADIVGFREDSVVVARGDGAGGFSPAQVVVPFHGPSRGEVSFSDAHAFLLADLTGNGAVDLVGFADDGCWVTVLDTTGPVTPQLAIHDFGGDRGWSSSWHERFAADLTGDGRADILGCGDAGVYVSLNEGMGQLAPAPWPS